MRLRFVALTWMCAMHASACGGRVADLSGGDAGEDAHVAIDTASVGDDGSSSDVLPNPSDDVAAGDDSMTPDAVTTPDALTAPDVGDVLCGGSGTMIVRGSASAGDFGSLGLGTTSGYFERFGHDAFPGADSGFVAMWARAATPDEHYTIDRAIFRAPGPGAAWSCATSGTWSVERSDKVYVRWELDALRTIGSCGDHHATGELHICAGGGVAAHGAAKCAADHVAILGTIDGMPIDVSYGSHRALTSSVPTPSLEAELEPNGYLYFKDGTGYLIRPPTAADPTPAILCFGSGEAYWSGPFEIVARDIGVAGACPTAPGTGVERGCSTQ